MQGTDAGGWHRSGVPRRSHPACALAALAAVAVLAAGVPAAADVHVAQSRSERTRQPVCGSDPLGDVAARDGGAALDEPAADLTQVCVTPAEDGWSFAVTVAEPADPLADPRWDADDSFVSWGVDTGGGPGADRVVVFGVEFNGQLRGAVVDVATGLEACIELPASAANGRYTVEVPAGCLGDPATVALDALVSLDLDPGDDASPVATDRGPDGGGRAIARLQGPGRVETAVAIAQEAFPAQAGTVYLARADVLADAVAAGSLTGGPVLLVPSCGDVPAVVAAEIARLDPDEVVALGGTSAVCDALLAEAGAGRATSRLAGTGRVETAVAISAAQFPGEAEAAYLARADELADAVAGGALTDGPILLVPSCGAVPAAVRAELDRLAPTAVTALGGEGAVCEALLADAAGTAAAGRLAGADRIETAVAIALKAFPDGAGTLYLARADVLADAVAGGTLTAGPVVLVPSCGVLPAPVAGAVAQLDPQRIVALGGEGAVCDDLLAAAAAA